MPQMIFVNLPVADLERAVAFYEAVGAKKDPRFSNDMAASMQFSDTIVVMLMTHAFFNHFTPKAIVDAKTNAQAIFCLSQDSREAVDRIVTAAAAAGGRTDQGPQQHYDHMYGRDFEDLDGHMWETMWMDVEAFLASQAAGAPDGQDAGAAANAA